MADIVSVTMPLLSIKDLATATFHQSGVTAIQVRVESGSGYLQGGSGALS